MTHDYDDELLKEVDDDVVKLRNAPSRPRSGWGIPALVVAILLGVVVGIVLAASQTPSESVMPTIEPTATAASEQETARRMSELEAHIAANPTDTEARMEFAELVWSIGNLGMANEQCDKVLEINPNHAEAWFLKGLYLWVQEEKDCVRIEEVWTKYMENDPGGDHIRVLSHLDQCKLILEQESATDQTVP
ncbi:MAG: hypothetical protein FWG47_05565 [Propionibacteriaceae bacterium]|nr:hypothetical protein [Propionibacteriaceae bacterium]